MRWRKSSSSGTDGDCVEIRGDLEALRDSKFPTTVMPVSRGAMSRLLTALRT
jgi:hypothetical protein